MKFGGFFDGPVMAFVYSQAMGKIRVVGRVLVPAKSVVVWHRIMHHEVEFQRVEYLDGFADFSFSERLVKQQFKIGE